MKDIKTPSFGAESITEGTVMEWKVKAGDSVKQGDLLVVIETDKVSIDVHAEEAGKIVEILAKPDDTVEVGNPLCKFEAGGGAAPAAAAKAPVAAAPASAPAATTAVAAGPTKSLEVKCPDFGAESITEGTVGEWLYKVGDWVKQGELIATIETDKVNVEINAPESGELTAIMLNADDTATVGAPLCTIKTGGAPPVAAASQAAEPAAAVAPAAEPASAAPAAAAPAAPAAAAATPRPAGGTREETRAKMPRMRQAVAKNLKNAQNTLAMLSTFNEVDMTGLMAFRKQYKELFEETHGVKFGLQSVFFKAAANALLQIPAVNGTIQENDIVYRDYVDIGFAAATPRGLVVPVIRNVESLNLVGIERAFADMAGKAKADKLTLPDMEGGTFSISNGGVFGSMLGTPMIGNTNSSAILGLHGTKQRPVVMPDGSIAARPIMYVALTYDHRLVDGREAVTFLKAIKEQVEQPARMLLDV